MVRQKIIGETQPSYSTPPNGGAAAIALSAGLIALEDEQEEDEEDEQEENEEEEQEEHENLQLALAALLAEM